MKKSNSGITLVALVVTIIVLIILAGVSISLVLGDQGILTKARAGRNNYAVSANAEAKGLRDFNSEVDTKITQYTAP